MATAVGQSGNLNIYYTHHHRMSYNSRPMNTAIDQQREFEAGLRRSNRTALEFLGTGLGMLFATMGFARAMQSTTMALKEFGIVTEDNEKKWNRFNAVIQVFSGWTTFLITLLMLKKAATDANTLATYRNASAEEKAAFAAGTHQIAKAGIGAPVVALAIATALAFVIGIIAAATARYGYSGVINEDTVFFAHAGEQVNIGPAGGGGGGGTTIINHWYGNNFDDMVGKAMTRYKIIQTARGV